MITTSGVEEKFYGTPREQQNNLKEVKEIENPKVCIAEEGVLTTSGDGRRSAGMFSACNPTFPRTPRFVASWTLGIVESFPQTLGASRLHSKLARLFDFGQDRVHSRAGIGPGDRSQRSRRRFTGQ